MPYSRYGDSAGSTAAAGFAPYSHTAHPSPKNPPNIVKFKPRDYRLSVSL
jgi:hypothetical protein